MIAIDTISASTTQGASLLARTTIGLRAMTLVLCAMLVSACCSTTAVMGVVIGDKPPLSERTPGHLVVVCPGEDVTLGWAVDKANSASVTDLGSVAIPTGTKTLKAGTANTDYTITAKGKDCDAKDTAQVIVASPGTPFVFSAEPVGTLGAGTLKWEAVLSTTFYSPKVKITSVKLNVPATAGGWIVSKVDVNGTVHSFTIFNNATTPWSSSLQLAGTWQLIPKDPASELNPRSLPPLVELQVTLTCE